MSRRRRTAFEESAFRNDQTYLFYFDRLRELALSLFEWKDLPEEIPERFLEETLFDKGHIVFFRDEVLGYLTLPATLGPGLTVYGEPVQRQIYCDTGYSAYRTPIDSVVIYNNRLRLPDLDRCSMFALRLAQIDRIIDVNVRAQKTPVLLQGTEKQRLTLLNLYKEYDGNAPAIFGDKNLDLNTIKAITTGAPYVSDRLYDLKIKIWNEALTYLGIPNLQVTKKANLLSDEVQRLQGGTVASRLSRLLARQQAAQEINKMFDLNISVDFRNADGDEEDQPEEIPEEGGPEDE